MLLMPSQSNAWIAYGFKSGMSRFDIMGYLSDNESLVTTEGEQQMYVGPGNDKTRYKLIYCSVPQKLYLMQYNLADSLEVFVKTKEKYEKRYGQPSRQDSNFDDWETEHWESVDVSFIWDLNESETILLRHGSDGTHAEFQDLSACQ